MRRKYSLLQAWLNKLSKKLAFNLKVLRGLTFNQKSQICNDNEGSFTCACNSGYYLYGSDRDCFDVNECNQKHACPQHSDCNNTIGSYGCTCHEGYHMSSASNCTNINECTTGTHNCSQLPNQHCIGSLY